MILEFSNEWSPALNRGKKQIFQNLKRSFSHEMISSKWIIDSRNAVSAKQYKKVTNCQTQFGLRFISKDCRVTEL